MKKLIIHILSATCAVCAMAAPFATRTAEKSRTCSASETGGEAKNTLNNTHKTSRISHRLPVMTGSIPGLTFASKAKKLSSVPAPLYTGAKAPSYMPTIYGSVIYNDDINKGADFGEVGLYEIAKNQESRCDMLIAGVNAPWGGVAVDNIYYATSGMEVWGFVNVFIYGYNIDTGEQDLFISGTVDNISTAGIVTDPTTGLNYGLFLTEDMQGLQLGTIEYGPDAAVTTPIAPMEGDWNSIAFDGSGQLYGISYTGSMVDDEFVPDGAALNKIDKATGVVTKVGDMEGYAPKFASGSVIDPKTNKMYWNYCVARGETYMCEVDLASGHTTTLYRLSLNDEIMGMYIPTPEADPKAPGECSDLIVNFEGGSLEGKITVTAPQTLFDGTSPDTGTVKVYTQINGETVDTRDVAWGADVEVPANVPESGRYTFSVYAENTTGAGPKTSIKQMFVGTDSPAPTTATLKYENGIMTLNWLPVTSSQAGGWLDLDQLSYTVVRYPDGVTVAENTRETQFSEAIPEPDTKLESYYYGVTAVCGNAKSSEAKSNHITIGCIVPPYFNSFDNADSVDGWTSINVNNDDEQWHWEQNGDESDIRNSFTSNTADDWFVTPRIKLEKGKAYLVNLDVRGCSTTWKQKVEVKWGSEPTAEGMTNVLVEPFEITDRDFHTIGALLAPKEDGYYYVGVHDISDPDQLTVVFDNFRIEEGISSLSPGRPSDLTVIPDINGGLTAAVSFTAPAVDIKGEALVSLDKVDVYRDENVVKAFENVTPGAALSFIDTVDKDGLYTYRVIGYNEHGTGLSIETSNFIGINLPGVPGFVSISNAAGSNDVTVTWEVAGVDVNGNPLLAENVSYSVYRLYGDTQKLLAKDLKTLTYSFTAVEDGVQAFVQCAVYAETRAGKGEGTATDMIAVGTPYDNVSETFADGDVHYEFGAESIEGGVWEINQDSRFPDIKSVTGDNGFIDCKFSGYGTGAALISGLVDLSGMQKPGVGFYVYNVVDGIDDDDNIVEVYVKAQEEQEYTLLTSGKVNDLCSGTPGWNRIVLSLAAYAGKVVQVKFVTMAGIYRYTCLDDLYIGHIAEKDLSASYISAPALATCGKEYEVNVGIANVGTASSENAQIDLYVDGDLTATLDVPGIESGSSAVAYFEVTMPAVRETDMQLYAVIRYAGDESADNDQTETISVKPLESALPAVENLSCSTENGVVELCWHEPDLDNYLPVYTEDFENGEGFSGQFDDWTFVDKDGSPVGGFQDMEVPGITKGDTTGSFWVWDWSRLGADNLTFEAHSGVKYLFSLFRNDDGMVDDWAISPELNGHMQTISFYARSYSASYPERIEIWYSTDGTDIADFQLLPDATVKKVPGNWTYFSASLPEGARYFAIRSCATGSFMLMVDDVTYSPAGARFDGMLMGYDVYRDGAKINDRPVEECEFLDSNVERNKTYTYHVVAVFDQGSGRPSEAVMANLSGIDSISSTVSVSAEDSNIVVTGADGLRITIVAADGTILFDGTGDDRTCVRVESGVYMVRAGSASVKMMVK